MRTAFVRLSVVLAALLLASTGCARTDPPAGASPRASEESAPSSSETPTPTPFRDRARPFGPTTRPGNEGHTIDKHALVYLPPGYGQDTSRRYGIVYLMHGAGQTAGSLLGGPGQASRLAADLDRSVAAGDVAPMIVVTPTFYPDDNASLDLHNAGQLDRAFARELEDDLMPAVEGTYRTFASSPDAGGFRASRDHRASSGFSMGGVTSWYVFLDSLELFRYFAPMAGDCWVDRDTGGMTAPEQTAARLATAASRFAPDDYLVVASVGSNDDTRYQMEPQIREMRKLARSFDDDNLRFNYDDGGGHDLDSLHAQLAGTLPLLFWD